MDGTARTWGLTAPPLRKQTGSKAQATPVSIGWQAQVMGMKRNIKQMPPHPCPPVKPPTATAQHQPATQARWPVEQTPQTTAQASESVVQGPLPAAPKPPADGGAGTVVARGTTLPESATAPGISYRLTYAQQRRLQYE